MGCRIEKSGNYSEENNSPNKSNYIAHTEPLFIQLGLFKVQDIFKFRLLKFYYKLCYGTLPHFLISIAKN